LWCAALFAAFPGFMTAHIAINHFATPWLGPWTALLYPEVLAAAALTAAGGRPLRTLEPDLRRIVRVAFAIAAWFAACAAVQGAYPEYWIRRIGIEWVVGPLLGLAFARHLDAQGWRFVRESFLWSMLVAAVVACLLYYLSFGIPTSFEELVVTNRTGRMQAGLRAGVYFGELTFGGVNDIAVIFGLPLILYAGVLMGTGERHPLRLLLVPLVLIIEYLCYSRGTLIGLALSTAAMGLIVAKRRIAVRHQPRLWAVAALFYVLILMPSGALGYWTDQILVRGDSTAGFRARLWSRALEAEASEEQFRESLPPASLEAMRQETERMAASPAPAVAGGHEFTSTTADQVRQRVGGMGRRLLFGYGTGNYGVIVGATPDMGIHNMFLEGFLAGGLPGLALVLWFWLLALRRLAGWVRIQQDAESVAVLTCGIFIALMGIIVSVRLESLGTLLIGSVVWLLVAGPYRRRAAPGESV